MTAPIMSVMPTPDATTVSPNGHHPTPPDLAGAAHPAAPSPASPPPPPVEAKTTKRTRRWGQIVLTVLGWGAASVLSADGAWNFFTDTLRMPFILRCAAFALFEIAVLACAVTARDRRIRAALDGGRSMFGGVAGIAVWAFAALSGVFSASHETIRWGQGARFVAPLIAAFLFELLIAAEAGDAAGKARKKINHRFTPERIMVRLGLADPSDRTAGDVARDRAISRLATLAARAHNLQAGSKPDGWKSRRARAAYVAHLEAVNEQFGLAGNTRLMEQWRTSLRLLQSSMDMTAPDAVGGADPWSQRPGRVSTPSQVVTSGANRTSTSGGRRAEPGKRERVPADQLIRQYDEAVATNPGQTEKFYAEVLGVSTTRLREVRAQFGRTSSASPTD